MFFRPIRKMRNIFASLRGGEHPAEIAAGVCLGVFLGLTPFGLHLLIPIFLMLVFRCSTGLAFFSMGISKGFYLMLAGPFYHTGFYLLNETELFDGLIRTLMQTPIIGFMGFNRYLLFGSYVVCIAASLVLFPLVYVLIKGFRSHLIEWVKKPAFMQTFIQSTVGSWVIWLCFGNPGDDEEEEADETGGIGSYFGFLRLKVIGGLAGAGLLVFLVAFLGYGLAFTSLTSSALSSASGVDVRVESASFSPFTGRMSIEGIAGADPSSEKEDLFQVDEVVMDLNMYRVLAGKLHVSEVSLNKLLLNVRRNEDGSLNIDQVQKPAEEKKKEKEKPKDEQTYTEWVKEKGKEADWIELVKKYGDSMMGDEPSKEEKKTGDEQPPRTPEPGVEYRDGKRVIVFDADAAYPYKDRIPLVRVRKIALTDAEIGLTDQTATDTKQSLPNLEKMSGTIKNLSSDPSLLEQPITTSLEGQFDGNKQESLRIDGSYKPNQETSLKAALTQLDLARLRPLYKNTLPVQVKNGQLSNTAVKGSIVKNLINAPTTISLTNLNLKKKRNDQKLFGMKPDTSQYILDGINAYAKKQPITFDFLVDGPVNNPQFHWKGQFLAVARKGLKELGRQEAQKHINRINGELKNMKGEVEKDVKKEIDKISKSALESATSGDSKSVEDQVESSKKSVEENLKEKDLDDLNPFGGDD